MDAVFTGYGEEAGREGQRLLCPGLCGHYPGMRFNKVDIAWYGNLSAMEAVDRANGQFADRRGGRIAGLLERVDRQQRQSDQQPERSAGEAKDLTFGNGDPNSTSGFLVPGSSSSPKTISPPATLSAPSTPGMKPMLSPSPTSRWMWRPTTPKTSTS